MPVAFDLESTEKTVVAMAIFNKTLTSYPDRPMIWMIEFAWECLDI